ncbi:type I restriction enzyme M protein [Evansella vedderi]|uniref:site-specific DNA-methyltransferase (adenine-specific) n=1 Tax=Evansella vedderi TaxID=38282 RepID=A0ABU0A0T1_9BACI|nr:type I restriction-modification system subunit M [Evansella vedderi]MDQ0257091.1 type I restriction enzyme M protein [Evansella vedderi]
MENIESIEKRLWEAADDLRANSKLTSTEYYMPVLGLIFLRHAFNRYLKVEAEIKKSLPSRGGVTRQITREDFLSKNALFLQENARFDYLINLPEDRDRGQAIIEAMDAIEEDYDDLKGVLPKDYHIFENDLLTRLLKVFNDEALNEVNGDVFGRIYEYFIMKFALQGAQDNGEFFTPVSLVQMIVNTIEPDHGIVLDPACGSGGMFVQTSHFLDEHGQNANSAVTFYGQEKTSTTIRLAKMNLAVHGLEGKIAEANTFYEDQHELLGKCNFVMANPPFNVDKVDAEKVKTDPRLPFGLPGVSKSNEVNNGNYLWMSYFYSYLNDKGRSGFVMSSQASSSGGGDRDVRRKIIETGHVDIMISIRGNFFYTRTVPCELWFYDKGKPKHMKNKVLMIDAKNIYRKVTRKVFDFSPEQLKNLTAITWLYRGQEERYLNLIKDYFNKVIFSIKALPSVLNEFEISYSPLISRLSTFSSLVYDSKEVDDSNKIAFTNKIEEINIATKAFKETYAKLMQELVKWEEKLGELGSDTNSSQLKLSKIMEPISVDIKKLSKQVDDNYKILMRTFEFVEKEIKAKLVDADWKSRAINKQLKELNSRKSNSTEELKQVNYFLRQINWLQSKFPNAKYQDIEGLVKLVDQLEMEKQDWSLNPGRYVGVAPEQVDDEFDFDEVMNDIHLELKGLNDEAEELAKIIQLNFKELGL